MVDKKIIEDLQRLHQQILKELGWIEVDFPKLKKEPTLRHVGFPVKNLEQATKDYQALGFKPMEPIEILRVQKMTDSKGAMIELVEGNWHEHIAVNWYETEDGNYVETVEEKIKKHRNSKSPTSSDLQSYYI